MIDADEYALKFMEQHTEEFPQADISLVIPKVCQLVQHDMNEMQMLFESADKMKKELLPFDTFKHVSFI